MGHLPTEPKPSGAYAAYIVVSLFCVLGSLGIAAIVTGHYTQVTDSGFWAVAAMTASPTLLGLIVSFFIYRTSRSGSGNGLE